MNLESIIQDLKKFFNKHLNIELDNIKDESLIVEELGADSITLASLFAYIKDTYEITLDESVILQNALSIKSLAEKIFVNI